MTDEQLHTLRHMLGINNPRMKHPIPCRNHAFVVPGDPKFLELEALGVIERDTALVYRNYHRYSCTDKGKRAALESYPQIRWSRSKRRYWKFRQVLEAVPDLTFREFLTSPEFSQSRRDA